MRQWAGATSREELLTRRWLRPFARHLSNPFLWRFDRRGVAWGMGLGLFAAFAVPVAQTPAAAILATGVRANLPVAAAATFITNPLTVPVFYPLAYLLGARMLQIRSDTILIAPPDAGILEHFLGWLLALAGPTYLGLLVFAAISAVGGYFITHFGWGVYIRRKRQARLRRQQPRRR